MQCGNRCSLFPPPASQLAGCVAGADVSEGAAECAKYRLERPALLVLGSEGRGLRPLVRKCCTQLLRIGPGPLPDQPASGVDSLNVSVAAGVLLHHLLHAQYAVPGAQGGSAHGAMASNRMDSVDSVSTELSGLAREQLGAVA